MAIPAAAKIGGASLLAIGTPGSIYLARDHIFLYQIERDVLKDNVNLLSSNNTVPSPSVQGETYITTISHNNNKWSCVIRAKLVSGNDSDLDSKKDKFKKHVDERLPISPVQGDSSSPLISEEIKKLNKRQLVLDCSENRNFSDDGNIQTSLTIEVTKIDNTFSAKLFGKLDTVNIS